MRPRMLALAAALSSGAESVASAVLQVDLSGESSQDVTVDYAVTGTATGGGVDYTLANGTLRSLQAARPARLRSRVS